MAGSSPESSLDSPDLHPFRVSYSGADKAKKLAGPFTAALPGIQLSRSTSDGYEGFNCYCFRRATSELGSILFESNCDASSIDKLKAAASSSSFGQANFRRH